MPGDHSRNGNIKAIKQKLAGIYSASFSMGVLSTALR